MSNAILEVRSLNKAYPGFALKDISFDVPYGSIMGFIGQNGAGKTTTIKAILNLISRDSGQISILGMDNIQQEHQIKQQLGVIISQNMFLSCFCAGDVDLVLRSVYEQWDSDMFYHYIKRFGLDPNKEIAKYSTGMCVKLEIAAALSHHATLLLLDEPTSGLDPIVREEILDLFWEFLQDEGHSILLSTHITSDLDKIADSITFIHNGSIVLSETQDKLVDTFGILKCSTEQLHALDAKAIRAVRHSAYGEEALVYRTLLPHLPLEKISTEQLMLFLAQDERVN